MFLPKILICLLLVQVIVSQVSTETLRTFINLTYDQNDDQLVSWKQFCDYFKLIQPDHFFSFYTLNSAFQAFDIDNSGKISLSEFQATDYGKIQVKTGHKQIHLGFTENQHQMQVIWVSTPESYAKPVVIYGNAFTKLTQIANATTTTYNVGHLGFHGGIYRAVMKNLKPLTKYYYKVGDLKTNTFSEIKHFKSPPSLNQSLSQIRMSVFGDMGTYVPFGHLVSKLIANKHILKPYDFVFLTGDIAYAGVSSKKVGQLQPVWDLFGQQTQSFAAYTAFMPGVGNHESYYDFAAYFNRYRLPRINENQTNLWFSFDYGQVHMIHFSSQHNYQKGSQQYKFLQDDLRKARSNPNIKWIILGAHRAFYCSDKMEYSPITPLAQHLQDLINEYDVDLVLNGHLHSYQRTWPVFKGKAMRQGQGSTYYVNPKSPIYVVQGTAGALINQKWINPSPQWSMRRFLKYGYGQITIKANYLKYQYLSLPVGKVIDTWYIVKDESGKSVTVDEYAEQTFYQD